MKLYYSHRFFMVIFHAIRLVDICAADPTDGFTLLPLSDESIAVQRPYNIPLEERYSDINGVRRFWVFDNDKPHSPDSHTKPRTEARVKGLDYYSGTRQFEGYAYVPRGTSGVSIMQIFGGSETATNLQLRMYNGVLKYYNARVVEADLYDKWFRVNVIHNVDEERITIFIDGVEKLQVKGRGAADMYFKFGVYAQKGATHYMESRWKDVKIYRK